MPAIAASNEGPQMLGIARKLRNVGTNNNAWWWLDRTAGCIKPVSGCTTIYRYEAQDAWCELQSRGPCWAQQQDLNSNNGAGIWVSQAGLTAAR